MARRRLLLLLKPFDVYPFGQSKRLSRASNPQTRLQSRMEFLILWSGSSLHLFDILSFVFYSVINVGRWIMDNVYVGTPQFFWGDFYVPISCWITFLCLSGIYGAFFSLKKQPSDSKITGFLENRYKVHKDAVNFCQDVLRNKAVDWTAIMRTDLSKPIHNFDFVVTVGGDGTLLQASHFMDDSIPVLGVNSDPTQVEQVEGYANTFDATRSTGYLCAATVENFEQVLDDILEERKIASKLSRLAISVNSIPLPTYALNDVLIAHPCPATVSRFSFKILKDGQSCTPLAYCRSSGLRLSTAAGSTAATLSAGGFAMPILSQDLQYMVREPISPKATISSLMHGIIKTDQSMEVAWFSEKGVIYIDGSHVRHAVQDGDTVEISSKAPFLKVFLPCQMLS